MRRLMMVFMLAAVTGLTTALVTATPGSRASQGVTVHEWGTFTTVAGPDGRATGWLPLGGPSDLPCFVEHYRNQTNIKIALGEDSGPIDYETARAKLVGRVRMETPVLYFYSDRATSAYVRVAFPRGIMTEWYPHAIVTQPPVAPGSLRDPRYVSYIEWENLAILPNTSPQLPGGSDESHYYAARGTDAAPVRAYGQSEKFLFYRGVADFDVPITAVLQSDGSVRVTNTGSDELPNVVLFENRGGRLGYTVHGALSGATTIKAPALTGTFPSLRVDLEKMLVNAGLYAKEATAMVDTWRDSWFEEGTRVLYIVPGGAVDAILPLSIVPAPAAVKRVFVGRMDVITPYMEQQVEQALDMGSVGELERHGRLLGPIAERVTGNFENANTRIRTRQLVNSIFASYVKRAATCN